METTNRPARRRDRGVRAFDRVGTIANSTGLARPGGPRPDEIRMGQAGRGEIGGWEPPHHGGKTFERGVGTHALSTMLLNVGGKGKQFAASVGVDDETRNPSASVDCFVLGDKKVLWKSGRMALDDAAKPVDVDISGVLKLGLLVTDAGDGINYDHADWADARIEGDAGLTAAALTAGATAPVREPYILTPPLRRALGSTDRRSSACGPDIPCSLRSRRPARGR